MSKALKNKMLNPNRSANCDGNSGYTQHTSIYRKDFGETSRIRLCDFKQHFEIPESKSESPSEVCEKLTAQSRSITAACQTIGDGDSLEDILTKVSLMLRQVEDFICNTCVIAASGESRLDLLLCFWSGLIASSLPKMRDHYKCIRKSLLTYKEAQRQRLDFCDGSIMLGMQDVYQLAMKSQAFCAAISVAGDEDNCEHGTETIGSYKLDFGPMFKIWKLVDSFSSILFKKNDRNCSQTSDRPGILCP